jgi:hypothetical protein
MLYAWGQYSVFKFCLTVTDFEQTPFVIFYEPVVIGCNGIIALLFSKPMELVVISLYG